MALRQSESTSIEEALESADRDKVFSKTIDRGFGIRAVVEGFHESGIIQDERRKTPSRGVEPYGFLMFEFGPNTIGDPEDFSVLLGASARWARTFLLRRRRHAVPCHHWTAPETWYRLLGHSFGHPPPVSLEGTDLTDDATDWGRDQTQFSMTEIGESSLRDTASVVAVPRPKDVWIIAMDWKADDFFDVVVDSEALDDLLEAYIAWVTRWCASEESVLRFYR